MNWEIRLAPQAEKDWQRLQQVGFQSLKKRSLNLLRVLEEDPYQNPPPFKMLTRDFSGCLARRLDRKHRLVYQVFPQERGVKILRFWGHYDD
jgi:toxin YoeB